MNPSPQEPHTLQCSEVWGGNDEADRVVVMQGLDACVLSRPHEGASGGGDIHYLSSCATGRITRILIADVAGHGRSVADVAVRLRNLMRRFVNFVDQTYIAGAINREFLALAEPGRFATAVVATYWAPTGELEITNAGHPRPLRFDSARNAWSFLTPDPDASAQDLPLGIIDATTYGNSRVTLRGGDLVLLYTDALLEARGEDGSLLGESRLLRLAAEADGARPDRLVDRLHESVRRFARGGVLDDDATLLLLKPNGLPPPRGSLLLGVTVTFRLAGEFLAALFRRGARFARPQVRRDNVLGAWFDRFNRRGSRKP